MENNIIELPKKKDIYWEHWLDPLEEIEPLPEGLQDAIEEDGEDYQVMSMTASKAIFGAMGYLTATEDNLVAKKFKFWVGQANFSITANIAEVISLVQGVETLDIWTRYRFRVGIGTLFEDKKIMCSIRKHVLNYINGIQTKAS
jgi:hypothetical protein